MSLKYEIRLFLATRCHDMSFCDTMCSPPPPTYVSSLLMKVGDSRFSDSNLVLLSLRRVSAWRPVGTWDICVSLSIRHLVHQRHLHRFVELSTLSEPSPSPWVHWLSVTCILGLPATGSHRITQRHAIFTSVGHTIDIK